VLSNRQKGYLAQLASRAHVATSREGIGGADDGIELDEWRRREVAKACGKFGLRCCSQDDYRLVEGHFLNLLGQEDRAMRSFERAAEDPKRRAEIVLCRELARYGFLQSYAEKICRDKFKCTVSEASSGQTWKLVYDIKRNGERRLRKKEMAGT
jgi:hypothetical protein